jgi:membrane fusion protein (multidrug efflux system)
MKSASETPAPAAPHSSAPAAGKPAAAKARRGATRPIVAGVLAVAALAWIAHFALHAYHYVETDNAYIVGHLHQVSPQVDGQVKDVLVTDNQEVKAGDVLVRLDPLEYEIATQKAIAALAQARAQENQTASAAAQAVAQIAEASARVAQAEAGIVQSQAQLDLAKLTAARNDQLLKAGGAVTQADVDNSRSNLNAAQAALAAAAANRTAAEAAVGSAQAAQKSSVAQAAAAAANVAAAEAALRDTQRQLAYTTLTAPAAGRVGNKNVEPGNRVSAGQTLLALTEPAPWIVANFKETQLPRMAAGQPVEITVDALPGQMLQGHIDSLAPASGAQFALLPPDNATGNFNKVVQRVPVKIVLEPESLAQLGNRLRFGYSVVVSVRVR